LQVIQNIAKKFFLCPDFQTDEFADFLITLAKNENIRDWVLIPSNDHAVYTLSRNKKKLQGFYKVISPDLNIVERIYDKKTIVISGRGVRCPCS
jgi:predicted ATP-grasp superfamily ATP-dependent carboligase